MVNLNPVPAPPSYPCESPLGYRKVECQHSRYSVKLRCRECDNCKTVRRLTWKRRIASQLPDNPGTAGWSFLTLTMPPTFPTADYSMLMWRRFRKSIQMKYPASAGYRFVRCAELQQRGAVHFHVLHNWPLPHIPPALDGESRRAYTARMTREYTNHSEILDFVAYRETFGFGWVGSNEPVYKSSSAAADYVAKYLSGWHKQDYQIRSEITGRSFRLIDASKGWLPSVKPTHLTAAVEEPVSDDPGPNLPCDVCTLRNRPPHVHAEIRRGAVEHWRGAQSAIRSNANLRPSLLRYAELGQSIRQSYPRLYKAYLRSVANPSTVSSEYHRLRAYLFSQTRARRSAASLIRTFRPIPTKYLDELADEVLKK